MKFKVTIKIIGTKTMTEINGKYYVTSFLNPVYVHNCLLG